MDYARQTTWGFGSWLGLAPHVLPVHLSASLSTAAFSISFLVFISAATPFVLSSILNVPTRKTGDLTGILILADELTALAVYLPVGAVCDRIGIRVVAATGYAIVSAALVLYVQANTVWQLVLVRILFASGAGSLVATISAVLSSLTELPPSRSELDESGISETSTLLPSSRLPKHNAVHRSARLAGFIGLSSGVGALLAVFGYLRLPNLLAKFDPTADPDSPTALANGLVWTFYLVAGLSLVEAIFVYQALPDKAITETENSPTIGFRHRMRALAKTLAMGFVIAKRDRELALAFATSFATRAQAVVVTAMIPLLVNRVGSLWQGSVSLFRKADPSTLQFFLDNDLCIPRGFLAGELPSKTSCRQAYILASILTGIVQLVTLVLSPLVGLLSASTRLGDRTSNPEALVLAVSFLVGASACAGFALLPAGDPRAPIMWLYVTGLGLAQAAGTVLSLAMITNGRGQVMAQQKQEVAGKLSSAYSFCGGIGILLVGSTGGLLFDKWSRAPFVLLAVVDLVVATSAAINCLRSRVT
ncbi:uncharacterized protein JCM15063_000319 [Sporobolomyces koalae]|uniref:uncharacterized protein n=1 Tax=Sporobolomyces koalae TaxID=500713 RepID=UPI0031712D50